MGSLRALFVWVSVTFAPRCAVCSAGVPERFASGIQSGFQVSKTV